jgi:hypothetical protein
MGDQPSDQATQSAVNAPDIDPITLQPRLRAIKDAAQAYEIVRSLEHENRERVKIGARIMDRYNAERPQRQSDLEAQGLAWKANFSTKPLPYVIDKLAPRFLQAVEGMKFLTSSAFPENAPGAMEKTETFRREITKLCRTREGWTDLIADIAQEDALFGFTSVAWHDEYCWFPKHFRQDSFFVPHGTKHYASSAQIYVAKESYLLHEFWGLIQNPAEAEAYGWNITNSVKALNDAQPESTRNKFSDPERVYADLTRELTIGSSYASGARTVDCYHVFATEITGTVTHYIISNKDGKELFHRDDRFASMSDVTTFFSFQHGNGKLHGSKGVGRDIYNMAAALDKSRNETMDRLHMSGKVVFSCEEKQIKRFRMSVFGNAVIVSDAFKPQSARIDGAVEPYLQLDDFLSRLIDELVGATTGKPTMRTGDRVTRAEVEIEAGKDEERRDAVIARFLRQFVRMVSTIQRRACSPQCNEQDAVQMKQRLLEVMTEEEMIWISNQAAAETVADYSEQERQAVILASVEGRGHPLYNQKELEKRKLAAQVNEEFAEAVLLPDNDPTQAAEQTRQQMLENELIASGKEVPVSPRDNFEMHMTELEPLITSILQMLVEDGSVLPLAKSAVAHAQAHLQAAAVSGVDKQKIAQAEQVINQWVQQIAQIEALAQQAAAQGFDPNGNPLAPPAAPPGMPAPGGMPPMSAPAPSGAPVPAGAPMSMAA